ncbi:hypothetical protein GGU11DRAFT_557687 [Lentinula aff. detonsa]|uniref:GYF domain-containing protein n=1 Tax=Lentinula aff. detonsa TaxID=2804958 RepID=A0AA38NQ94_9AGAR|nr:hypothetical protein GGU10DRAFT_306004 [Lentinula aff. detonsa]KAJ3798822.1 hypothetical protein GGU11DRAFT_557687 [Lentinula aff. detonsa]
MSQPDVDDNSSDNHGVQYLEHPAGIVGVTGEPKKDESPTATATTAERLSDTASIKSTPPLRSSNADQDNVSSSLPPPSPSRSAHTATTEDRSLSRRRSITDPRSSRRISGFFNNLIHRRDAPARAAIREEQQPVANSSSRPEKLINDNPTRSSSPAPSNIIPPPRLPPPTLQELGLSFSVITADLSPSHFSTPPSSGAFLSPHYLLLCHAQGLDVLPLISPPEPQPYALIRRVSFKSIVVMEKRGVLVAIAGRRDGVRVYALEEIRKAVEWRIDVEVRRERERTKREMAKKVASGVVLDARNSSEKLRKTSLSTPPPGELSKQRAVSRKSSHGHIRLSSQTPPAPLIPRTPTIRRPKHAATVPVPATVSAPSQVPEPSGRPPPYSPSEYVATPHIQPPNSMITLVPSRSRSRGGSVSDVLVVPPLSRLTTEVARPRDADAKDWAESSDDEAINVVAAGHSGSQALDERTSATGSTHHSSLSQSTVSAHAPSTSQSYLHTHSPSITRRNRPANLDLSLVRSNSGIPAPEPSPAPTLLTLRQALAHPLPVLRDDRTPEPDTPRGDVDADDDEDEEGSNSISLTQALLESRLPDLPPPGTRRPQLPIFISSSHPVASPDDEPTSPRNSVSQNSEISHAGSSETQHSSRNRRRRWSLMLTQSLNSSSSTPPHELHPSPPHSAAPGISLSREQTPTRFTRSSGRSHSQTRSGTPRRPSSANTDITPTTASTLVPPLPRDAAMIASTSAASVMSATSASSSRSRFIPRIISHAIQSMKSDSERPSTTGGIDSDTKRNNGAPVLPHAPPPKLEYVKLPGTKGSLMIKAVETAKKSFLAILCGENGEKVELFAGTCRTALGLSRTFILPDSPRSLELQLQGDDLVEVFLVFSQNVFGLEPATVRVREVRIGRAERRAARRRARELRNDTNAPGNDSEAAVNAGNEEENTNVNVSIGVSVSVGSTVIANGTGPRGPQSPQYVANEHPQDRSAPATPGASGTIEPVQEPSGEGTATPAEVIPSTSVAAAEELIALATARMGPYTTFQQLSFAPQFPLASIADEYVIPPTYPDFIGYREEYEPPERGDSVDLSQVNFSPPGLPVPTPSAPSKWFYRDPKGNVHGPWKSSLMQAWYKDGLLPPDLPVRKEDDTEYILLKDLRLQSLDPMQPFKPPPAPSSSSQSNIFQPSDKPLLKPISLLSQPKHFGPPALFYSSRGGHSTTIVDARGRSVLKGRFLWSEDDRPEDDTKTLSLMGRMGDVKRLEAVDIKDRSVLIAMRQGGVEAVDLGDALFKPGDESRTTLPQFNPLSSHMNRRAPFVWRIGTPVASSTNSATILSRPKGNHLSKPKLSAGLAKSPGNRTEFNIGDAEPEYLDEVLFLGRKNDEIYICERNSGSFRILRLCPSL